ncbi:MAG: hypothetical protein MUC48_21675 [Leptolyngbya sp. Prado105]|jgi:tetratricopeptide (TPR) repeat protein|nr:hypothetical protein [Leptolyngbya sp. Prado105]
MSSPTLSWYNVPEDIKSLLLSAARSWEDTAQSEQYIIEALAKADVNLDVLITAYRYFFYKNNLWMALQVAQKVVDRIRELEQLPEPWSELKPILLDRREESNIRLYLNAYGASGLVWAKLGELEKAKEITSRIKEIDGKEFGGATVVFDVLTQPPEEDD